MSWERSFYPICHVAVFPYFWNWTIGTISPPSWYNTPSPHYEVTVSNSSIFVHIFLEQSLHLAGIIRPALIMRLLFRTVVFLSKGFNKYCFYILCSKVKEKLVVNLVTLVSLTNKENSRLEESLHLAGIIRPVLIMRSLFLTAVFLSN